MGSTVMGLLLEAVMERLRGVLPAEATVSDGPSIHLQDSLLVEVGVDMPRSRAAVLSGQSASEWATVGRLTKEEGTITCVATAWRGSTEMRVVRDEVLGVRDALASLLRADPRLGVTGLLKAGISGQRLRQIADGNSVAAQLAIDVSFTTSAR